MQFPINSKFIFISIFKIKLILNSWGFGVLRFGDSSEESSRLTAGWSGALDWFLTLDVTNLGPLGTNAER